LPGGSRPGAPGPAFRGKIVLVLLLVLVLDSHLVTLKVHAIRDIESEI
jgi:hypothetical protein